MIISYLQTTTDNLKKWLELTVQKYSLICILRRIHLLRFSVKFHLVEQKATAKTEFLVILQFFIKIITQPANSWSRWKWGEINNTKENEKDTKYKTRTIPDCRSQNKK